MSMRNPNRDVGCPHCTAVAMYAEIFAGLVPTSGRRNYLKIAHDELVKQARHRTREPREHHLSLFFRASTCWLRIPADDIDHWPIGSLLAS